MARNDGRLEPGQPLRGAISARAWNRMMDASDIVHGDQFSVSADGPTGTRAPYSSLQCEALEDVPQWGAVELYEQLGSRSNPARVQADAITWKVRRPTLSDIPFGIAVEPIAAGSVGRVAVSGVVPAIFDSTQGKNDAHRAYLRAQAGSFLPYSAAAGYARVIASQPSVMNLDPTSSQWNAIGSEYKRFALVHLGSACSELRAEFSGRWEKGASKSVHVVVDGTMTSVELVLAKNYIATIDAGDEVNQRRCTIALINGEWQLTAWDATNEPSYTSLRRQVLSHDTAGCVAWSETFCRARSSGPWGYGQTKTLRFYQAGTLLNQTVTARNLLTPINAASEGADAPYDVILAWVDEEWTLVGFDMRKLVGFSSNQRRMLVCGGNGIEFMTPTPRSVLIYTAAGNLESLAPPSAGVGGTYVLVNYPLDAGPSWRRITEGVLF